jgi:hypothetical protein
MLSIVIPIFIVPLIVAGVSFITELKNLSDCILGPTIDL